MYIKVTIFQYLLKRNMRKLKTIYLFLIQSKPTYFVCFVIVFILHVNKERVQLL